LLVADYGLENRVTVLEAQMNEVREDIGEIKDQLKESATKEDLDDLKAFFKERDETFQRREDHIMDNVWKIVFALVALFGALITISFGLREIPKLF